MCERYSNQLKQARDDAKAALDSASKINNISLEKGLPNDYKQKFATLPDSVDKIEADISQCESVSQCSYDVDEKVIEDFNNRKKLIEKLKAEFEKKSEKLADHQNNYETLKNDWIQSVEEMISQINEKFSALFKQLKCSGEIGLGRPDNTEDFAKYGISIRVSFRSDERLQELTAWQQSGGEKSVSTMMYMIALQEMTKCPFRVVDEINQVKQQTHV